MQIYGKIMITFFLKCLLRVNSLWRAIFLIFLYILKYFETQLGTSTLYHLACYMDFIGKGADSNGAPSIK